MKTHPLILASESPRRADLLRQFEVEFEVIPGRVAELPQEHLTPHELCQLNAYRKARAVAKRNPDALILSADTEVSLGSRVFGKPTDLADAHRMLEELQGRTHEVVSGVCLLQLRGHRQRLFSVSTWVTFHPLSASQIERYLKVVNPLDKAGAYAIQEKGEWIIQTIEGSFSNVVGLPIERLLEELAGW